MPTNLLHRALSWWALPTLLLICVSCKPSETSSGARGPDSPNVILITLDTTRADHLGCYGYSKPTSPRLDDFAGDATLFTNAICTASVTPVSHASILTALYPYTHGLRVLHGATENKLPDEAVTLAEALKANGYQTGAFISAFTAGKYFGLDQGFDTFDEDFINTPMDQIVSSQGAVNTGTNQRGAAETTDLALDWLSHVARPYLLWLHYFDPHDLKVLPPSQFLAGMPQPTGSNRDKLKMVYDVEIQYMDHHLGRVFDALKETGQLDKTVVVIVSDHGEGLGDHNWWTHGILYREQIHAPLIIRAPGTALGRQITHLVRTIDIMPTILELVGFDLESLTLLEGKSLVPMLEGNSPDPQRIAYADSVNMLTYGIAPGITDNKDEMLFCLTDGEWKYIHHLIRGEESELYHLIEDPGELNNLFANRPDQVKRLLDDLNSRDFMPKTQHDSETMPSEAMDRLKTLGYIK